MKKTWINYFLWLMGSLIFQVSYAGGAPPIAASIVLDPSNLAQNAATAAQTLEMLKNQAQQLQNDFANLKNYKNKSVWSNTLNDLKKLGETVQKGKAIAYSMSNIDEVFRKKYPGYKPPENYSELYQMWTTSTLDTLNQTLQSAGLQANDFATEQERMDKLKLLSDSAQGRMQAAQAGNMIAGEMVGQLQKLRQLLVNQTNAQNAYMAFQVSREAGDQANIDVWIKNSNIKWPDYDRNNNGFGEFEADMLERV